MTNHRFRAALAALLPLAACVSMSEPERVYSACRVVSSSDWRAWVEILPPAAPLADPRRRLIVTGKVTTAGGGFDVSLAEGPVSMLDDPVQQILVRTEGSAEAGAAPVTHDVRGAFAAMDHYGGIAIRCGDGIIAEISDVPIPPRTKREDRFRPIY